MKRLFIVLIYLLVAGRLLPDIWGSSGGTTIDLYGRFALTLLVAVVISPMFALGAAYFMRLLLRSIRRLTRH